MTPQGKAFRWLRLAGAAVSASCAILLPPLAHADEEAEVVYTIEKTSKDMKQLDEQIEQERRAVLPAYDDVQSRLQVNAANVDELNARVARYNERLHAWNRDCLGQPFRPGDGCEEEKYAILAEKQAIADQRFAVMSYMNRLAGDKNDYEAANAHLGELIRQRAQLMEQLSRAQARLQQIQDAAYDKYAACRDRAQSGEDIKHSCGNVQFDGAAVGLPPCTTEKCRRYEAMRGH